jgi:predicted DNA binding protein
MWLLKVRWKHDCIVGNRCAKFGVTAVGIPLDAYKEKGEWRYLHFQKLVGTEEKISALVKDLRGDPKIKELEVQGDTVFFTYALRAAERVPTTFYHKKVFFLKPVIVDKRGYEHWEIASTKKDYLMEFVAQTRRLRGLKDLKIEKIVQAKVNQIYFPQIMPLISREQQAAIELAAREGYFDYPRKTELRDLARLSKKSLSTFREHLRKAEKKLIPGLIRGLRY